MPFPALHHVALTVRDLSVSVPWYEALFEADPVIDEDTDPAMHHTVYLIATAPSSASTSTSTPAPAEPFSEFNVGLDHVSFGCADRAAREVAAPAR